MTTTTIPSEERSRPASAARDSAFAPASAWAHRYLAPFFTSMAVVALSVMLVFTIYFTQVDLQWTAFLLGVLFAAVLSMVSQSVKAQWRLVRRTAQLRRAKERLSEEVARHERSAQALKLADQRFRTLLDAAPTMIFFVDRDERCLYRNATFVDWVGLDPANSGAIPLRELVGDAMYRELCAHGAEALLGHERTFVATWRNAAGEHRVSVKLLPYPVGAQTTSGYYGFATPAAPEPASAAPAGPETAEAAGEAAYFTVIERELTTHDNPREYLLRALEADQFMLLEQKIEPLASAAAQANIQPNMREVLVRLCEDGERTLAPAGFFEIAERYGLMPAIDRWVVRKLMKSCAAVKSADRAWRMPLYCINVGTATLADRDFASHVQAQLQHWEIAGHRLCFEIDHGALAEREDEINVLMATLRPLGCRFSVDRFGSQKVSFAPFRHLRFDFLKIDGAIVGEIASRPSELAKVRAIVLACQKLDVRTIAQAVENAPTQVRLREIGVDYAQGYVIEKPAPLAVIAPVELAVV